MSVRDSIISILWLLMFLSSNIIIMATPVTNSSLGLLEKQHLRQPCATVKYGPTYLKCHVPVLDNYIDFSVYAGQIAQLEIHCDTVMPSRLLDGFFEPLGHSLKYIDIYDCYFVNISRNALRGMTKLRGLWIIGGINSKTEGCGVQLSNESNLVQDPKSELVLHLETVSCDHDSLVLPEGIFSELKSLGILQLAAMRLNSSVWRELENLSNLGLLYLSNNDITTIDINTVSKLRKLKWLYLNENYIQSVWRELENLSNLERLYLSNNDITTIDINTVSKLRKLWGLYLNENYIQSIRNGTFESLSLLRYLDLSRNRIRFLERGAFQGLTNLYTLLLSTNHIRAIEKGTFKGLSILETLHLSQNSIKTIEKGTFKGLSILETLHLSQNSIKTIETDTFKGLIELRRLDLSGNQIKTMPQQALSLLTSLSRLNMSYNYVETLPIFPSSLTSLDLMNNKIVIFNNSSFLGLSELTSLNLGSNGLAQLAENVFWTNNRLQFLDLSFNQIVQIPSLPPSLNTLDLRNNNIVNVSSSSFVGLIYLQEVNLAYNGLVQLPEDTFRTNNKLHKLDLAFNQIVQIPSLPPSLKTLDLRNNNIVNVSSSSFVGLVYLQEVNLGYNGLVRLAEDTFGTNYILHSLDLSFNQIAQIPSLPRSLKTLKLSNNNIVNVSNTSLLEYSGLSMLDLSQNKIRECSLNAIPNTVGNLNLSSNDLSVISFNLTRNLNYVDLRNNKLSSLSIGGLKEYRFAGVTGDIYLAGNGDPFQCVCNLEVLNKDVPFTYDNRNDLQYRIRNLTSLNCSSENNLGTAGITEIPTGTFMCNTSCHGSCTCYHWKYTNNINIVNCLNAGLTSVPVNISVASTILDLSGNTFESLRLGNFSGLSQLKELYLNSSKIEDIKEGTFGELYSVTKLDLSNNSISRLNSGIFKGLNRLSSLDLACNRVNLVVEGTFESLHRLKDLDISENEIEQMSNSDMTSMYTLKSLKLSKNPWSCKCTFLENFKTLTINKCIKDRSDISCLTSHKTEHYITQINMKKFCPDKPVISDTKDTAAITISTAAGVLVITILIGILWYKNRKFLKVCCFVHFGWKFGCVPDDEQARTYDAFVSYCSLDDAFIIRELMPRLEGPRRGQQGYKLCVHFRDFPVGEAIAEVILDAVQNSRRTIMIISDNFLRSEWCHFEFQAAHYQLLREKKSRIIMVLLHDINTNLLDEHLKMFLRTRTYVKHGDPFFWDKIEYAMPERKPAIENNLNVDNIDAQANILPAVVDEDIGDGVQLIA